MRSQIWTSLTAITFLIFSLAPIQETDACCCCNCCCCKPCCCCCCKPCCCCCCKPCCCCCCKPCCCCCCKPCCCCCCKPCCCGCSGYGRRRRHPGACTNGAVPSPSPIIGGAAAAIPAPACNCSQCDQQCQQCKSSGSFNAMSSSGCIGSATKMSNQMKPTSSGCTAGCTGSAGCTCGMCGGKSPYGAMHAPPKAIGSSYPSAAYPQHQNSKECNCMNNNAAHQQVNPPNASSTPLSMASKMVRHKFNKLRR